jgi:cytochrome P450
MKTDVALDLPGPGLDQALEVGMAFAADPVTYLAGLAAKHGPIFKMPVGPQEYVFLNNPELAERMLRLDFEDFGQSTRIEDVLRPMLGRCIATVADHPYWEQIHAIMLPMFTPKMLHRYFAETVTAIEEEVVHLSEMQARGVVVQLHQFVREGIFTALTRTIFVRGVKPGDAGLLLKWFASADNYMNMRYLQGEVSDIDMSPPIKQGREDLERISQYVYDLIAWRHANPVDEPEDMLDVLMQAKKSDGTALADVEVRDNAVALFFGGQETTPSIITGAFGLLSANPGKREKLFEEIDRVLGGRAPTFRELSELKYAEGVLDEALRLYPPFSFIGREAIRDVELGGYRIPKGTALGFVGWTIHRDPQHWPNPEAFEPERHSPENRRDRAKCAFIAFGYGQRRCIGERVGRMEGLLMLALLSQKLMLNHVGGGLPAHKVVQSIKPADGMPMTIVPR